MRKTKQCSKCSNFVYNNFNECVLHCYKSNNSSQVLLEDFFEALEQDLTLRYKFIQRRVILNNIHFPNLHGKKKIINDIDYFIILKSLTSIDFMECTFLVNTIELPLVFLYFEECTFKNIFYISDYKNDENNEDYIFYNCKFDREVKNIREDNLVINVSLFNDCLFRNNLNFKNINFNKNFIRNSKKTTYNEKDFNLEILYIDNCTFMESFKLNQYDIDSITIKNSYFLSEFEVMNTTVKSIYFDTCNIAKIFDANSSVFIRFLFYKVRFEDFSSFEKVTFGCTKKCITRFLNNTFEDYSNFRNTEFLSGLDFSTANLKQAPNFLGAKFHGDNTDRETFRIIKNSFEKISNFIEANRFFVQEMNVYRREINYTNDCQERFIINIKYYAYNLFNKYLKSIPILILSVFLNFLIIFDRNNSFKNNNTFNNINKYLTEYKIRKTLDLKVNVNKYELKSMVDCRKKLIININYHLSEFGNDYIKPIFILVLSVILYTVINITHVYMFKNKIYISNDFLNSVSLFINKMALNFLPFTRFLEKKNGIEMISLLFYIWFAILVWQIIVAVKRNTQH